MDKLREFLQPLTDFIPTDIRTKLPLEAWWGIIAIAVVVALLLVFAALRGFFRLLFGRRQKQEVIPPEEIEHLESCPLPPLSASQILWIYHLPARLRLVVVAPAGTVNDISTSDLPSLFDRVIPGLGTIVSQDKPRIRLWPPQLSKHGFDVTFRRRTQKAEPEGAPSRWVLLAGKANAGGKPILLGLALWTDEPSTLGHLHLEPHQWLDLLRIRPR